MNIVMISNYSRPEIVKQSILSLMHNASDWSKHHFTLVWNGLPKTMTSVSIVGEGDNATTIMVGNVGASRARNVGASSIPKYLRQSHVAFVDDDVAMAPRWDSRLEEVLERFPFSIVSPYGHPYNLEEERVGITIARFPTVISSVFMVMKWEQFDRIGWWAEPGGAGASEDVDFCRRSEKFGYSFAICNPHVCIHTGITSSNGSKIVGHEQLMAQNKRLEVIHGMTGRVIYG